MPYKSRVPCRRPDCASTIPAGSGYCEQHRKAGHKADRDARGSAQQRGYDSHWHKYRNVYLSEHPLCVMCQQAGRVTPAEIIDHIIPLDMGGDKWANKNLQALCRSHHTEKTARDSRG